MLLRLNSPIFPPLQPEHTGRNDEFQLFRIGDPRLGEPVAADNQLAVIPHPVRAQILPLLTSLADDFPGGGIGDGGDPLVIGPEREL
ncbi:TPA: hypothetical protein U5D98_001135 [Yersinia enterocolitica]|nr:hypothetical protein [Yersinia enterocolitica]